MKARAARGDGTEPGQAPMNPLEVRSPLFFWIKKNLLGSWLNAALTAIALYAIYKVFAKGVIPLARLDWSVIGANLKLIMTGSYPASELWRVWLCLVYASLAAGFSFGAARGRPPLLLAAIAAGQAALALAPLSRGSKAFLAADIAALALGFLAPRPMGKRARIAALASLWLLFLPVCILLIAGCTGPEGILPRVETNYWGGLMLSLIVSLSSILLSFPIGLVLALGRRSSLALARLACTAFIEIVRGVPLITILFIAYLIVPLALPPSLSPSVFIRAMIGTVAFHSAYMAENLRGGLQGIPRTQYEAAASLGLGKGKTMLLVILPQVLKRMIPVLVSGFTGNLKDTSLVSIIGLLDMIGVSSAIVSNPQFMTSSAQVLVFMAAIYFILCYGISGASVRIEKKLGIGDRKAVRA